MMPFDIRSMANAPLNSFNRAFVFNLKNEADARPIRLWNTFAYKVLSITMEYDLAIRYVVLDGTTNKECINVMCT